MMAYHMLVISNLAKLLRHRSWKQSEFLHGRLSFWLIDTFSIIVNYGEFVIVHTQDPEDAECF